MVVDVETGEARVQTVLGGRDRGLRGEKLKPNTGFVMMWPEEMRRAGLSGSQWELFSAMCQLMNPKTGAAQFYAQQLVEILGYSDRGVVHRLIRQLIARGAVRRVEGEMGTYAINPNIAWNGNTADRAVARFVWENGRTP